MLKGVDLSLFTYTLRLPKKDLRILIGLLTGHADLNRHLHQHSITLDLNWSSASLPLLHAML